VHFPHYVRRGGKSGQEFSASVGSLPISFFGPLDYEHFDG